MQQAPSSLRIAKVGAAIGWRSARIRTDIDRIVCERKTNHRTDRLWSEQETGSGRDVDQCGQPKGDTEPSALSEMGLQLVDTLIFVRDW